MKKILLICILLLVTSILGKLILFHGKPSNLDILEMVYERPDIFQLTKSTRSIIKRSINDYKKMSESNFKSFEYGRTLTMAKRNCLEKGIDAIKYYTKSATDANSYAGHGILRFGNTTNSVTFKVVNTSGMSKKSMDIYTRNLNMLAKAIPINVPNKKVLSTYSIDSVKYLDDYAQIEFIEDARMDDLYKKGQVYRGQF